MANGIIASYSDGSGLYEIDLSGDVLTTRISDENGETFESFKMTLTRAPHLDSADWSDWELTERFASNGDDLSVLIDGEAFTAEFV